MSPLLTNFNRGAVQDGGGRAWHLDIASLKGVSTASGSVSTTSMVMPELCIISTTPIGSLRELSSWKNLWNIIVLGVIRSHDGFMASCCRSAGLSLS